MRTDVFSDIRLDLSDIDGFGVSLLIGIKLNCTI